jgi:hypothetical protein
LRKNNNAMGWIRDERRPEVTKLIGEDWSKSKKVLVLIEDKEPLVAEFNKGEDWEQWYCPAYEDVVEGVTAWCDCIPQI